MAGGGLVGADAGAGPFQSVDVLGFLEGVVADLPFVEAVLGLSAARSVACSFRRPSCASLYESRMTGDERSLSASDGGTTCDRSA